MSLIIATGSNLGDKKKNLLRAKEELQQIFHFIAESRVYSSAAVDYQQQPDFFNQVVEFSLPKSLSPKEVLLKCLEIEQKMGRVRKLDKGPRLIDIDLLFWGVESIKEEGLTLPHPSWSQRSFVVHPLKELPYFPILEKYFTIPTSFDVEAYPH